jgi:pimeloyl-ACP methyl ester carboxylesterase
VRALGTEFTPFYRGGQGPPLVCLHGFTDTWRTWELVLPSLERHHDVFAPTLAGHAGGPPIEGGIGDRTLADALERALDEHGIERAHIVGNSLGGALALQLAERGRALSVVALAPAGGFPAGDRTESEMLDYFTNMLGLVAAAAPHAESIIAAPDGRRRATQFITTHYEHIPHELLVHQLRGAAGCASAPALIEYARRAGWRIDAERVTCPVRIVWGTADRILPWPVAATRFREEWFPNADWVELQHIGHCPQLDVPIETAELIRGFTQSSG